MRQGFGIDYVHGPFKSQRERDTAVFGLMGDEHDKGQGCDCERCMKKPANGRPKKLPANQINVFHDGAFWIADKRGQPW